MPRPKCFCHRRLTMTRAVSGFSDEPIHLRQREAPARRAAVRPRDHASAGSRRWPPARSPAASAGRGSPRRRESGSTRAAPRSVPVLCGTIAAWERRRDAALRAADDLVALAERREAVVAVGGDLGHRQRRRPLLLERGELRPRGRAWRRARSGDSALSISSAGAFTASNTWMASSRSPGVRSASGLAAAW